MRLSSIYEFAFVWLLHLAMKRVSSDRLILTPYLQAGNITFARDLCKVEPDIGNVTSYSGYFMVNETCGNNLFFWFFPAVKNWLEAPVVLWLQGGPGSSSMYGVFELIGPWNSLPAGLQPRNYSWTNLSNLLFIDNPVGAGFSYTEGGCYPRTIQVVVEQLYSALTQFFTLFHELQGLKFILAGESFAAHYLPVLALLIHKKNECGKAEVNMSLAGIVVGNPLLKLDCHDYGSFLFQVGIAGESLRDQLYFYQDLLKENVASKNYSGAFKNWDYILNDLVNNQTKQPSRDNINTEKADQSTYVSFLNSSYIRELLHVGDQNYSDINWDAYNSLNETIPEPFDWAVERILQTGKYIVAFYSGQLDIICMYTSTVCIMHGLQWPGSEVYLHADRVIWYIDDAVVGWVKNASYMNSWLLDILIRDSGHSVPYYKPQVTYLLIDSILSASPGQNPLWKFKTNDDDSTTNSTNATST